MGRQCPTKFWLPTTSNPSLDTVSAYLRQGILPGCHRRQRARCLFQFRHEQPDLVVLDVMMPEMDGWSVAPSAESDVPLIFLTARVDDIDQVTGLEIGGRIRHQAVQPRVLVARTCPATSHPRRTGFRSQSLARATSRSTPTRIPRPCAGRAVDLTPSEFGVLQTLIARPGRVFRVWNCSTNCRAKPTPPTNAPFDVHVKNLRSKIELDPHADYVETVYGVGYRMRPDTAQG